MAKPGAYFDVVVERCRESGGGGRGPVRVRPVPGQGISARLRVERSKEMRNDHPIGARFRIQAKPTDRLGEGEFLHSSCK
jgi:hypothetical protein